jgi:hypothetical protein
MVVIVEEEVRKESSAMITGLIRASIGPLAGDGLNEAFGLAIGLRAVGFGEEMFEAEFMTGGGEEFGAVGRAAVGKETLDLDAMSLVEVDSLMESVKNARDGFIGQEAGKGEAGMIVNGDVKAFDAGAAIAQGAIAGGADAGAREAAQFLDVEVKELAGRGTFVAHDRGFWRFESGETMKAVAAQDAGERGFGKSEDGEDLSVGAALPAQGQDVGDEPGAGSARLTSGDRGAVLKLERKTGFAGAGEPATNRSFADVIGRCDRAQGEVGRGEMSDHFGSHLWSESGISVHVVRGVWRLVWYSSTTSLPDPCRADNLLKHDT